MKLIWQQKTLWIPISPGFSKSLCLLEELLWHLFFCLLLKRHWLQFRGVRSEKVQCQIVLKTCPFHLLSGYRTQMKRGFLSLETFWSTECRKSTGGTNNSRHWDPQDKQGAELVSALGGQRGVSPPGNPNFAQVLQHMGPLKTAGCEKDKLEGKISSF